MTSDLRDAAEAPERVLDRPDEVLGRLAPDDLRVALAREAENDPKEMRPDLPLAARLRRPGALAEVDLALLAGRALHPPERQRHVPVDPPDEPLHALVAAGERLLLDEVLVDPLRREPEIELLVDHVGDRVAEAFPAIDPAVTLAGFESEPAGPTVRSAGFSAQDPAVDGWFWIQRRRVASNRLPVDAELAGDPPLGPPALAEASGLR